MRYKIADYKIFDVSDHIFLFLVSESAIFEIESEVEKIIKLFEVSEEPTKEEIIKKIKEAGLKNYEERTDTLITRRIFIPSGKNGGYEPGIYHDKAALKTLVLDITDACNLCCSYCYHKGDNKKRTESMSRDTAEKAVDFLFGNSGKNEEVVIVFFGGEPLLNFDLITFITDYARKKAGEFEKEISFAITTNGTLLSENVIDFFYENRIGVTVSIDGSERIHDRFRRFSDGSSSYRVILPKIKNLIDKFRIKGGKPVVARVTVAKDAAHVPETLDHLLELGFAEAGFAPVTTDNSYYRLDDNNMSILLDKFKELSNRFLQTAAEKKFFGFTNLIDLLVLLHEGEVKNYPCGAGLGLFAVSADEKLYLCQRLIGEESLCMGNLSDGFDMDAVNGFRKDAELGRKPECRSCWARFICAGGCYHEALVREKKLTKANLHYCQWIKEWILTGLDIYCKLVSTDSDYLDKLSILRGYASISGQII